MERLIETTLERGLGNYSASRVLGRLEQLDASSEQCYRSSVIVI